MPLADLDPALLEQMQRDWDKRARENARCQISDATRWNDEEFYGSGRRDAAYASLFN